MFGPMNPEFAWGDLEPLVLQNELHCYDLVKGKLKWDLGASDFLQGKPNDPEFAHSHFLGVPINIGGKLYVLNEKVLNPNVKPKEGVNLIPGDSELRLVCLDPKKLVQINSNMKPTIESIVSLGKVAEEERMLQNIRRRVNAATPAYADGILVCPTNAGELLGIDLLTRTLTWSYSYRESAPLPIVLPGMPEPKGGGTTVVSKWKSSPPAIQDGKVVFTAPDADSIHCVNLKGGRPVWRKSQQKGDRYFAGVFGNRVLIVGDTSIRALDLKDGNLLWSLVTGDLPSGQGAAANGIYYLPLTKEILAVDIAKGIVKAHNRFPAGASSPGNLVFYQDLLLSQTATDVTAYPQLKFDK
jgi:hypothetical protein